MPFHGDEDDVPFHGDADYMSFHGDADYVPFHGDADYPPFHGDAEKFMSGDCTIRTRYSMNEQTCSNLLLGKMLFSKCILDAKYSAFYRCFLQ